MTADEELDEWSQWSDMYKDMHGHRPRGLRPTKELLTELLEWHEREFPDGIWEPDGTSMKGTPAEKAKKLFPVLWTKDETLHHT